MEKDCRIVRNEMILGPFHGPRTIEQEARWMQVLQSMSAPVEMVVHCRFRHFPQFARDKVTDAD